ncbi:AMP-binding protein [Solibacillus sp. FSL K6-1554]|uniref:AMP-binding protein n=1 Tax=Solibacillus sp. FSL K6-1554 TaxID=2921472 RepID=UPI0030F606F8
MFEKSVGELLQLRAQESPDKTFLNFADQRFSYKEVDELSNRIANSLLDLGIKKGDKIAMLLGNGKEFVLSAFGILKIGAVEVPINTAHKKQLLQYQLDQSDSVAIIVGTEYLDVVEEVLHECPKIKHVIVNNDSDHSYIKFSQLLAGLSAPIEIDVHYTDIQSIMYTSGTTGPSKGVVVTHRHCILIATDWLKINNFSANDKLYTPLPLFHTIAHQLGIMSVLVAGAEIAVVEKFSVTNFWNDIRKYESTVAHVIFAMIPILLNQKDTPDDKNHNLRSVYIGPSALSDAFEERFGAKVVEVYGATETAFLTSCEYGEFKAGSCGKANDNYEIKIVDDFDEEVPVNTVGEIIVRSKQPYSLAQGYYNMYKETVESFRNLWFHTGDFGYKDESGYYYFVDRKKDAIRRKGENISSFEVEKIINAHPSVLETAAIAVPSELNEDEVKICVVLQKGENLTAQELFKYAEDHMAKFMVPRYIEFYESIPKTSNGKVQKVYLREQGINENTIDKCLINAQKV